jgi:anthranilate synthase component I
VSGAPKIRAMEIIAKLEPDRRGSYAGAVGFFGFGGDIETAITIRTIVVKDGRATVQAGAGIVADSDPETEFGESHHKAAAMFRAVEAAERFAQHHAASAGAKGQVATPTREAGYATTAAGR